MKPIKCEVWEIYDDCTKITYYNSIRKAIKYCRSNGLSCDNCIHINYGDIRGIVYWSWKAMGADEKEYYLLGSNGG